MPRPIETEFPSYPHATLPDLTGFEDTSWHNDACPSFRKGNYLVWIDWPDDGDREYPGGQQFIVCELDETGCLTGDDPVLETNGWHFVQTFLNGE
jgi:hypothetical protein